VVSVIHILAFSDSQNIGRVLCGEASKEITVVEKESDVFTEMELSKKCAKQTKESLYSQLNHEGFASSRLLSSIDYEKGILKMAILQPKIDKSERDLKPRDYKTTKFTIDFEKLPPEDKIKSNKQTGNIVARDLIQASVNVKQLKMRMSKLQNQLQIETATNKAH